MSGKPILFVLLLLLTATTLAQELKVLNRSFPGERFEIEPYLDRNKGNVVVFRSRHSPSCQRLEEALQQLSESRDDLAISLIDIDRKDSADIDWRSPLARQFNLHEVPFIRIFDGQGQEIAKGYKARKDILEMLDRLQRPGP